MHVKLTVRVIVEASVAAASGRGWRGGRRGGGGGGAVCGSGALRRGSIAPVVITDGHPGTVTPFPGICFGVGHERLWRRVDAVVVVEPAGGGLLGCDSIAIISNGPETIKIKVQ